MIRSLIFAACLLLAGCFGDKPRDSGLFVETETTVTIRDNGGGNTVSFDRERVRLEKSGKLVVIEGYCASSCTIFYSLPNACMAKNSTLHFHGSSGNPIGVAVADAILAKHYRAGIKENFEKEWINLTTPMKKVGRRQAKELDPEIKFCENM